MKPLLLCSLITVLTLSSCHKKYDFPDPSLKKIVGKWNWIRTEGGISGVTFFPKADGSDALSYEFTERALCIVRHAENKAKYRYEINQANSFISQQPAWFLSLHQTGLRKYKKVGVIENKITFNGNDTLVLEMDAYDAQSLFFVREK